MNPVRKAVRRAVTVIFPWPPKHERQAAIAAARRSRQRAEAQAGRAKAVEQQIQRMAAENHFASAIVRQITRGTP